jgi:Uma2 family endonuclease
MNRSESEILAADGDAPITADDLLALGLHGPAELIEGKLVMMSPSGGKHGKVANRIGYLLTAHVSAKSLGEVSAAETGFLIARSPDTVRAPDVGFVAAARVPPDGPPESYWPFAPDLAVEVVSPTDRWSDVEEKSRSWLDAGARLVWVVDPRTRTVHVYRQTREALRLIESDVLHGEEIVSGFSVRVEELFA